MKKQRLLSLLLALIMTGGLASCSDDTNDTTDDTTPSDTTAADTEEEGYKLSVPETDLDEEVITYLAAENYIANFRLICDETKGDNLNEAGYKRALAVSELLNVKFDSYELPNAQVYGALNSSVMAGEDVYDFVLPHCTTALGAMIVDNLIQGWENLEYVDFTKPWWNTRMQDTLSLAGHTYFASGDITMTWQSMQGVVFNKDYLEKYQIDEDLYETVWRGEWTIDKMMELTAGVGDDVTGDQKMTEADQYGLLLTMNGGPAFQLAMGQPITTLDDDGCPQLAMGTEKMINIVEKYYKLTNAEDTRIESYSSANFPTSVYRDILVSGRSFMSVMDIGGLYMNLRELTFDFGIIPLPKYDEAQESYYSGVAAGIIAVPSSANTKTVGMVAEALAYYSYEYIRPAFFDVVLQNKAVRDEESYEMLTLMHESKQFDFGWNFTSAWAMLEKVVVNQKSTDFASYYASKEESINKSIREIYDAVVADD